MMMMMYMVSSIPRRKRKMHTPYIISMFVLVCMYICMHACIHVHTCSVHNAKTDMVPLARLEALS